MSRTGWRKPVTAASTTSSSTTACGRPTRSAGPASGWKAWWPPTTAVSCPSTRTDDRNASCRGRLRAPKKKRAPEGARFVVHGLMRCDGLEPRAYAHAEDDRVEFGLAGLDAVQLHVRVALQVAHVGAREPGRVDVDVDAGGRHRALGRLHADALAGQCAARLGSLAVVVLLVVAQAHERADRAVGLAEVVLAAHRVGLRLDAAQLLAFAVAHAVAELVGRAPGFDRDVVVEAVPPPQRAGA